jgi:hypothetical protein
MAGLRNADFSAFVEADTGFSLRPPRDHVTPAGNRIPGSWVLSIGTASPNVILHVDDPAKLWELHDLIAATLPPREQDGGA